MQSFYPFVWSWTDSNRTSDLSSWCYASSILRCCFTRRNWDWAGSFRSSKAMIESLLAFYSVISWQIVLSISSRLFSLHFSFYCCLSFNRLIWQHPPYNSAFFCYANCLPQLWHSKDFFPINNKSTLIIDMKVLTFTITLLRIFACIDSYEHFVVFSNLASWKNLRTMWTFGNCFSLNLVNQLAYIYFTAATHLSCLFHRDILLVTAMTFECLTV